MVLGSNSVAVTSDYLIGKIPFEEDGTQNYLVFQPMHRCFKTNAGAGNVITFITGNLKGCLTKE